MEYKTKNLIDRFVTLFSSWPAVECIILNEAAQPNSLDPYFALILDVYYRGEIPAATERAKQYGSDTAAFETSRGGNKDRFFAGNLPVRMEYKTTEQIEDLVSIADTKRDNLWLVKDSGTYGFYRLSQGETLYNRSSWIETVRRRLNGLDSDFWNQVRDVAQSKMEHFLSDLGAAMLQDDDFFSLTSSSGFIKNACLSLFCINRRFEPSHRSYYRQVVKLPVLPESFKAQLESFLHSGTPFQRRYSIGNLIARGIITL
ncbi:hypothetical protein FACS1894151_08040 [Spirochaetia bacterium]|nr:hypothetical protein FACS1894151_08040 [Spirochaetia bacterium]